MAEVPLDNDGTLEVVGGTLEVTGAARLHRHVLRRALGPERRHVRGRRGHARAARARGGQRRPARARRRLAGRLQAARKPGRRPGRARAARPQHRRAGARSLADGRRVRQRRQPRRRRRLHAHRGELPPGRRRRPAPGGDRRRERRPRHGHRRRRARRPPRLRPPRPSTETSRCSRRAPVTGTFGAVTGGYDPVYGATDVKLRRRGDAPAERASEPTAADRARRNRRSPPTPRPRRRGHVASTTPACSRPRSARMGAPRVAARRAATLVAPGVTGRGLSLVAATCPSCGSVRVSWAGTVRTVSLRSRKPGRRTIVVVPSGRERSGDVRVRAASSGAWPSTLWWSRAGYASECDGRAALEPGWLDRARTRVAPEGRHGQRACLRAFQQRTAARRRSVGVRRRSRTRRLSSPEATLLSSLTCWLVARSGSR